MALAHSTAVRNACANAVVDAIDGGAGAGTFVLQTSGDVEVATLTFSDPAFADASGGAAAANSITSDTSATGGVVAKFRLFDSNATEIFQGTVTGTGGGGHIELSSTTIGAGETVACSAFTYTAMP
jgi:hypothetical protein